MKDKNVAGILALFLGWIGVHRFYLGQVGLGILYVILSVSMISVILGIIDAIVFFSMEQDTFDIKYNRQYFRAERRGESPSGREDARRQGWERREEMRRRRREHRVPRQHTPAKRSERLKQQELSELKNSGIKKYKDYDYDGAIADFQKALTIDDKDVALHFNLACAYSLNENTEKSLYHLDKAVGLGFDDFERIQNHDALAYLRIQDEYETFKENGYRLVQRLNDPEESEMEASSNLLEQLKRLGDLKEKGLLTEEEFAAQKQKLLDDNK